MTPAFLRLPFPAFTLSSGPGIKAGACPAVSKDNSSSMALPDALGANIMDVITSAIIAGINVAVFPLLSPLNIIIVKKTAGEYSPAVFLHVRKRTGKGPHKA